MSGIDASNLKRNRTYVFCSRTNLITNIADKLPHYYKATYFGRKGRNDTVWIFKNFTDRETGEIVLKKEIKFFCFAYTKFSLYEFTNIR